MQDAWLFFSDTVIIMSNEFGGYHGNNSLTE